VDLEDEVEPPEELLLRRWEKGIVTRFGERDSSAASKERDRQEDDVGVASGEMERLNLNKNRMSEAFGCYPYVHPYIHILSSS